MSSSITITIAQDKDSGTDEAMGETLALLAKHCVTPMKKISLTLECADEETAREYRDDLKVLLTGRPAGIEVKVVLKIDEEVERGRMVKVTPMDQAGWN